MFICRLTASHIRVLEFVLHPAYFVSVRAAGIRLWPKDLPFQQANLALELSAECGCITLDLKPQLVKVFAESVCYVKWPFLTVLSETVNPDKMKSSLCPCCG